MSSGSASLLLAVLVFGAFAAHALEFQGWILLRRHEDRAIATTTTTNSVSRHAEDLLRSRFDFRGAYPAGEGTKDNDAAILLWGSADDAEAIRAMDATWTVRFRQAAPTVGRFFVLRYPSEHAASVWAEMASLSSDDVVFKDASFALVNTHAQKLAWPKLVEAIPVPTSRLGSLLPMEKSPAYGIFKNRLQRNEQIEEGVAAVSSSHLYDNVYTLSEEFYTRQSYSDDIREAQAWLEGEHARLGLEVSTHTYDSDIADNVIGELRGTVNPEQIVVVGAHYDSRSQLSGSPTDRAPGADDNGSGSSAVLEIARVLTSQNVTFANTIRFIHFSGEEQGLLGSDAYAKMIKERGDDVIAMFNADMLGYRIPGTEPSLGMKDSMVTMWLVEMTMDITNQYVPSLTVGWSSSCCSDYISFFTQGYPAAGFFENLQGASSYPEYHTSRDTIDNLDFEQVTLHTQAVLASVMTFAEPL